MANQACVAIGINRYQFFQPLGYAQADAQALRQFLVEQAGWSPDKCLLLTDISLPFGNKSTYPSRENIALWLDSFVREAVQSGDLLWFFFSGHGVNLEGEDYLMPFDGNPEDVSTGISVRSLFLALKQRSDAPVLVLLDINRSNGQATGKVGQQTVELARNMGIPTILSTQFDEFSYEATGLSHGLFTFALLEALRYDQNRTLTGLSQYLRDRIPELCKHHLRPIQTPLSAIPFPEAGNQLVLSNERVGQESEEIQNANNNSTSAGVRAKTSTVTPSSVPNAPTGTPGNLIPQSNGKYTPTPENTPWWQNLLLWGSGVGLVTLMIVGVLLRNREAFSGMQAIEPLGKTVQPSPQDRQSAKTIPTSGVKQTQSKSNAKSQQTSQNVLDRAKTLIVPNQASQFNQAIVEASKIPPGDPLYQQAQQDITRWSGVILDLAKGRAQQGDFQEAIAAAKLVPSEQPLYTESQQAIAQWKRLASQQQANQVLLRSAKALVRPGQASSYSNAIAAASKVPSGQPGYAEAQKSIALWSQNIYLIAQSRASKGNFQEAIQAAALVPQNTTYYNTAQKAIVQWKAKGKK